MNPTVLGVIGPGFLNQVPTLPMNLQARPPKATAAPTKLESTHRDDIESKVNPRKLEHGIRMISAGIPYTLL